MIRLRRRRGPARWWVLVAVVCTLVALAVIGLDHVRSFLPGGRDAGGVWLLTSSGPDDGAPATGPTSSRTPPRTPSPTPAPPRDAVLTVVAGGDVLPHLPVNASARLTSGGYDFAPLLEPLRPWIAGADLALCHLEVPVAPAGTAPSGYPAFGAPVELPAALHATGWDGCSTASNHSLDRGLAGVDATLQAMDGAGLGHVGTARSAAEGAAPQVYELTRADRTVRVAHLAATYGVMGARPASAPWAVTVVDTPALVQQAAAARAAGADLVVVSIHCCQEYVTEPTAEQQRIAQELAASGQVDLVIGHHAHVPQPLVQLPGGPDGPGMWVAYGLGNMLSNQDAACCVAATDSGVLLTVTALVPAEGAVRVTGTTWTAVTVDRPGGHRVYPMPSTVTSGALGTLTAAELAARYERVRTAVGDQAPERVAPPASSGPPPVVVPHP